MRIKGFSHDEVAHIWAHQRQNEAHGHNMFFYGPNIYSYGRHFIIAKILDHRTVLVNSGDYSVSTSKHQSIVRRAIPGHFRTIYAPTVEHPIDDRTHKYNLDAWTVEVREWREKATRARKHGPFYLQGLTNLKRNITKYIEYFRIKTLIRKKYKYLYLFLTGPVLSEDETKKIKAQDKKHKAQKKIENAKRKREFLEKVDEWKRGKIQNIPWSYSIGNDAYLRATDKAIETSKGIKIDFKDARKLFIVWCRDPFDVIGQQIKGFKINNCTADFLTAGCHTISKNEALEIAQKMNWL